MRKYEVNIIMNGTTSAVDTVMAPENYTAEDYILDCYENADNDWNKMIHAADRVELIPVEG